MPSKDYNWSRAALVVAHPSHELRVHGWMQTAQPLVFVLTDGSGRAGEPRLQSTTKVLTEVGAQAGSVYGRLTDREVYDALLHADFSLFVRVVDDLVEQFLRHRIEYVVADADEGYSLTHDVCRLLTDAAIELVNRRHKLEVASFDFAVVGPPDECPEEHRERSIWIQLDDQEFSRKIAAARSYNSKLALDIEAALGGELFRGVRRFSEPQLAGAANMELTRQVVTALGAYPAIEAKVKSVIDGVELDRFRTECLRPVSSFSERRSTGNEVPFYEVYGEKMVAAGHYSQTLRHSEHFIPLQEAVWRHLESR
ncbi:MAG TPA: hypothetical protein VGO56_03330 [Pyrinomonadaceae bacterium]|jgi:hypothetical protein|nr:hypothetical protein [Pyrinomonadaceae bacterium]